MSPLHQSGTHKTCLSGIKRGTGKTANTKGKNVMQESVELHFVEQCNLFSMKSADWCQSYMVKLEVNEKPLVVEINTGQSFFVISEATHKWLWPQKCLLCQHISETFHFLILQIPHVHLMTGFFLCSLSFGLQLRSYFQHRQPMI